MADVPLDTQERLELCDLFDEPGPSLPTLLDGWTARDLARRLVLGEHDLLLYAFRRQPAAQVEVSGPPEAVAALRRTHFGM
jgi:hypothetical protein